MKSAKNKKTKNPSPPTGLPPSLEKGAPVALPTDPSPGPWGVSATVDPRVYTVWTEVGPTVIAVVRQEEPRASEVSRSNAHLIAAAPRLRSTLQEVKDYLEELLRNEGVSAEDRWFAGIYDRVNIALELARPHLPKS